MNIIRTLILFAFLLRGAILNPAFGQKVRVFSSSDNEPVPFAVVHNLDRTNFILTDTLGYFDLINFSEEDSISFSHPSYFNKTLSIKDVEFDQWIVFLATQSVIMDEFVVSASKYKENSIRVAAKVDIIKPDETMLLAPATSADLLEQSGNVLVQKSQGGGGSPIIRGFEANKVLLVVDGVRMNNAIYRSGHLQNSLTVDNAALERTEILFGPGSLVYGSDAIGGVVHYSTISPEYGEKICTNYAGQTSYPDYSTLAHADVSFGKKNYAVLSSITMKQIGDIHIGTNQTGDYPPKFGRQYTYSIRENGIDTIVKNPKPIVLHQTGYKQIDFIQKLKLRASSRLNLTTNIQFSGSSNIQQFGTLNERDDEGLYKYAEGYYGPQLRIMVAEQGEFTGGRLLCTDAKFSVAYQHIQESRHTRKTGKLFLSSQTENVDVLNLSTDFRKRLSYRINLHYGVESNINWVHSDAFDTHIVSGEQVSTITRYPDGGSQLYDGAVYLHVTKDVGARLKTTFGGRANFSMLTASFNKETYGFEVSDKVQLITAAPIGMYSVNYVISRWQLSGIVSSGFRSPNVDDIGKVRVKGDDIIVPNSELTPEYVTNLEVSVRKRFQEHAIIGVTGYLMYLRNAIVRDAITMNGQDSLMYNDDLYRLTANVNAEQASVRGVSVDARIYANSFFKMRTSYNYTYGWSTTTDEPLGHIPPAYGRTEFSFYQDKYEVSLIFKYAGWKYAWQMSTTGEDNDAEAPEVGFPSWQTVSIIAKAPVGKRIFLSAGVQNIFDVYYKTFASAVSAPGRNFSISIKGSL